MLHSGKEGIRKFENEEMLHSEQEGIRKFENEEIRKCRTATAGRIRK